MKLISSISGIIHNYDAFLLDLWGVVHDGAQLYEGVHETISRLRATGKKIVFLSNAPRRAARAGAVLSQLGIAPQLYDHIVTSGEVGHDWLVSGLVSSKAPWGKRYFFIGAEKDEDLLKDTDFEWVDNLQDADFILNLGFGNDEQTSDDFTQILQEARELNLPMLCLNPDIEVIKISGERFPCAGVIARNYQEIGGEVTWFGKPYTAVYEHSCTLLGDIPKQKILAIGDGLETDILGAKRFGVDCVLVTGGILRGKTITEIEEICMRLAVRPNYIVPRFA